MNTDSKGIRRGVFAVALFTLAFVVSGPGKSQQRKSTAIKFDELQGLITDDIQARLDLFATELGKDQHLRGFVVGYRREGLLPGSFLRELHGFRDYLVNKRGVLPDQVTVINGGVKDQPKTELWLTPAEQSLSVNAEIVALDKLTQFDHLTMGPDCESEYSLVLEQPSDAVRFFGEALRGNPTTKGSVIVHPSKDVSSTRAVELAAAARKSLTNEYGAAADRISTSIELRRPCASIGFWFAPANLSLPSSERLETFFQSQLLAEAEQNNYSVRRITLLGNTYTRDNVIRRRLLQNEGDTFRRALLEQSLRDISKLRNFSPVGIEDVEVYLNREDKLVDFQINLTERNQSRGRRG